MKKFFRYLFLCLGVFFFTVSFSNLFLKETSLNAFLSTRLFVSQVLAFPHIFGLVVLLVSLLVLVFLTSRQKKMRLSIISSSLFILGGLMMVLTFTGIGFARVNDRARSEKSIKIAEYNVLNNIDKKAMERIFVDLDTDVLVLVEFSNSDQRLESLMDELEVDKDDYQIFESFQSYNIRPVTIVAKKSLGYREEEPDKYCLFGSLYLKSEDYPDIMGLHTAPPLPGLMEMWRRDLETIYSYSKLDDLIIVGDFNANMRHGKLGKINSHISASLSRNSFSRGTWNSELPSWARTGIDHILVENDFYIEDFQILDLGLSDHLGSFAHIYFQ